MRKTFRTLGCACFAWMMLAVLHCTPEFFILNTIRCGYCDQLSIRFYTNCKFKSPERLKILNDVALYKMMEVIDFFLIDWSFMPYKRIFQIYNSRHQYDERKPNRACMKKMTIHTSTVLWVYCAYYLTTYRTWNLIHCNLNPWYWSRRRILPFSDKACTSLSLTSEEKPGRKSTHWSETSWAPWIVSRLLKKWKDSRG